jgi:hypothetical protein
MSEQNGSDPRIVGGAGHGQIKGLAGPIRLPAMDTAQRGFPDGKPISLLLVPIGALGPASSTRIVKGTIVILIPPPVAQHARAQFRARPALNVVDLLNPALGAGHGQLKSIGGFDVDTIDTGQDGFPVGWIDLLLVAAGAESPNSAAQLMRGSMVVLVPPERALAVRGQFAARSAGPKASSA